MPLMVQNSAITTYSIYKTHRPWWDKLLVSFWTINRYIDALVHQANYISWYSQYLKAKKLTSNSRQVFRSSNPSHLNIWIVFGWRVRWGRKSLTGRWMAHMAVGRGFSSHGISVSFSQTGPRHPLTFGCRQSLTGFVRWDLEFNFPIRHDLGLYFWQKIAKSTPHKFKKTPGLSGHGSI